MKFAAFILSFYFLLISAQPVLAATAKLAMSCESKCGSAPVQRECTKNQPSSCPQDENSCALCCYNVFQCTFCCGALVEENQYKISLHPRSAVVFPGADLVLHSSYSPDCWQPPEMI
jgi:hypothetical protein